MSVTDETIARALALKVALERQVDATTAALALAWDTAWVEISAEFRAAAAEIVDMIDAGEYPTRTQILRSQRAANAIKAAIESVQDLVATSDARITGDLRSILQTAENWQQFIVNSQLPDGIDLSWARVDRNQLDAIVHRSTSRIHAASRPLPRITEQRLKAALIRGVAVGDHPEVVARDILRRCQGVFNGGLYRARTIARTELLDSARAASLASRKANSDVLAGWRWHCDFSARTCPACLSMHGSVHAADEAGPLGHQNCRCTAVPVTRSWQELGFDIEEPQGDAFPDAKAWFDSQPGDTQRQIMGAERLKQYRSGSLTWDRMAERRQNPGWRDSYQVRPLR